MSLEKRFTPFSYSTIHRLYIQVISPTDSKPQFPFNLNFLRIRIAFKTKEMSNRNTKSLQALLKDNVASCPSIVIIGGYPLHQHTCKSFN